jgi:uncharacterized protein YjbI with pentapeptide repeats
MEETSAESHIVELQNALAWAGVEAFRTTIYVEHAGRIKEAQLTCDKRGEYIHSYLLESPGCILNKHQGAATLAEAFALLTSWLPGATIFPETVTVIDKATVQPAEPLYRTTKLSWCEAFRCHTCDLEDTTNPEHTRARVLQNKLWAQLTGGTGGIKAWNATPTVGRALIDWSGTQLGGARLRGTVLTGLHFNCANFDGADMTKAFLVGTTLGHATFRGATLDHADLSNAFAENADFTGYSIKLGNLRSARLKNCIFKDADLSKADLTDAHLQGADISTANTTDAKFYDAEYDENTSLPAEFPLWSTLTWMGSGPNPYWEWLRKTLMTTGVADFDQFCQYVKDYFHGPSLNNAFKMLKKERFQLFADVKDQLVTGVVKSQTNPKLAYSCSLASDGTYFCATQNLRQCGGLKGSICKHILVLVIGLAKSAQIDLTKTTKWILESVGKKKSVFDKQQITEVFLKYKKAEAGQVDWRPTETIPEDYYAF